MTRVGVLHTVPALVPVFHGLLTRESHVEAVHVADPALLASAISDGITADLRATIEHHLTGLKDAGAEAVLVTCSSIGEAAESAAEAVGVPLARVDAAMAAEAVRRATAAGGRVAVLATLEATLGPTSRLVERAAAAAGSADSVTVDARVVKDAADARAAGDAATHDALIGAAVAAERDADVIVLAQASMAAGAGDDPRVITSPESGAAAFVRALPTSSG